MASNNPQRLIRVFIIGAFLALPIVFSQNESAMQQKPFSPTQAPPNAHYVGTKTCALCHEKQAETQPATSMAKALETVADCGILRKYPILEFRLSNYLYKITREGDQSIYTVTDGKETLSEQILWCFGLGEAGQTYVFKHKGQYYESRVSFYNKINGLALTLGAPSSLPKNIEEAAGRVMQSVDVKDCFGCHATAAVSEAKAQLDKLTPGVTCEACHGPGAEHVALAKTGKMKEAKEKRIFNPASLSPYDLSQQFCGACHRSWDQVVMMGLRGVGNVRFQPYRITYSPCYNPDDRRSSCIACHDPHQEIERDSAVYDRKCLACHKTSQKTEPSSDKAEAPACKVSTQKCSSCHMPKYELPGSHFTFTDHMIRVVKSGEVYPN